MAAYVPTFTQVKAPEFDSKGMYLANNMFSQGLNSVVNVFKDEAAKQKEDNTYAAIGRIKQAAQEGITRNDQVQAAYSDPGIATFDANDAANLRASQASSAPTQLSEMLNQYTENRGTTPIDLRLLNQQYDTTNKDMQDRFDHREDLSMKLHDASTKEDQWNQTYSAGRTDAANTQSNAEARLKNDQARLAGEATERSQRMRYSTEDHQRSKDIYDAGLAQNSILNGSKVFENGLVGDLSIPAGDGNAVTVSKADHDLVLQDPTKVNDIATKYGVTAAQFMDTLGAAKADRAAQVKNFISSGINTGSYTPRAKQLLANTLSGELTKYTGQIPSTVEAAASNNNGQLTSGFNSVVNATNNVFKDNIAHALTYTKGSDGNYGFSIDPEAFTQITGMSVNDPRAAERVQKITEYANKAGVDSNFSALLKNTKASGIPSLIAQQAKTLQDNVADAAKKQSADLDAQLNAKKAHVLNPSEISSYFENTAKEFGSSPEATNGSKIAASLLQNVVLDPTLSRVVNEKFIDDFKQRLANTGIFEDRKGKVFSIDRDYSDIYRTFTDTLADNGVIDTDTADKMREKAGTNYSLLPGFSDLDQPGVAYKESVAKAASNVRTALSDYMKTKPNPANTLNALGNNATLTTYPNK
jgi:predicted DNA binding protein